MVASKLPRHAAEHWAASGLTPADAKRLEIQWLEPAPLATTLHLDHETPCGGLLMPYHDIRGKRIRDACRVRLLPNPADGWPGSLPKYLQPAGTPPRVYFPRIGRRTWQQILAGDAPLLLTEGEKKAAAATKAGFPTLGLGGVWSFMQKDLQVDLLPDLEAIPWRGRSVTIAYDSDWQRNKQVRQAAFALAERLASRGAEVRALLLTGESKWGLDDFLVHRGPEALREALAEAPTLTPEISELAEYHARFVLVRTVASAYDEKTGTLYPRSRFLDAFPDETLQTLSPSGRPTRTTKAQYWWQDPRKRTAEKLVLQPGEPRITDAGDLNLFRGFGVEPRKGDTAIWQQLLDTVFQGRRDLIRWFERWLAAPLQRPGLKLHQCVFVFGTGQGTGKSAVGEIMADIYGESARVVQDRELFSDFSGWLAHSLFALGDDLSFDERRKSRSVLKVLVDASTIEINQKYVPSYRAQNRCNFYLTSNRAAALPLDPSGINRRYLVVEAPHERAFPREWYLRDFHRWRSNGGAAAVMHRLLHTDVANFHPYEDAPHTEAKALAVSATRSNAEEWCAQVRDATPLTFATVDQLYALYRTQTEDKRTGRGAFLSSLRAHAKPMGQHRHRQQHLSLWCLRDIRRWEKASPTARVRTYLAERAQR